MTSPAAPGYILEGRPPTPGEYRRICTEVGWGDVINFDAAPEAVSRSLHACVALHRREAVGMGRVVGDGAIFFYVQDVAVVPAHQRRGVGVLVLGALMQWVLEHAPPLAFVGLFAAAGTESFYRRFGFEAHAGLTGMFQTKPGVRP